MNINNDNISFSSNAIKDAFFNEIFSWNLSLPPLLKTPPADPSAAATPAPLSFDSPGEYIDYWADLFFQNLKAKLINVALDAIRKNSFCNLFKLSHIASTTDSKISFNLLMDRDMCRNLDICRFKWLCITSKAAMDAYLSAPQKNDRELAGGFPEFSFLCCVKEVVPSAFSFAVLADGVRKASPYNVTVEGKMDQACLAKIKPFFEISENSGPFSDRFAGGVGDEDEEDRGVEIGYSELVMIPLENYHNMQRQFAAIVNVDCVALKSEILNPAMLNCYRNETVWKNTSARLKRKFKKELNSYQLSAVKKALGSKGVVLLQGPPGTGKTKTVLALLNLLHINAFNRYYALLIEWISKKHFGAKKNSWNRDIKKNSDGKINLQNINLNLLAKDAQKHATVTEFGIRKHRPRVLVCAPSNAAVDEIVARLGVAQLYDNEERLYTPRMIRLGNSAKIRENVHFHLSLSQNVDAFLRYEKHELVERINLYRTKLMHIDHAIMERQRRFSHFFNLDELNLNEEETKLFIKLYEDRYQIKLEAVRLNWVKNFPRDTARIKLEQSFIDEAEIVFSTLNSTGGKEFKNSTRGFECCIVDEAAQCTEPDLLIPLQLGVTSAILVGDHQQLPPTVFLCGPSSLRFETSLFERFQAAGFHSKIMLRAQYRMHPEISKFPSEQFYGTELENGKNVLAAEYDKPYHRNPNFAPYLFYDLPSKEERFGFSLYNTEEANFVIKLLESLCREFGPGAAKNVGVITPYKEQMECIKNKMENSYILKNFLVSKAIEIATVDFYQGREKDIIVLSCVRSSKASSIGFVADVRRLNVSLTRAKYALWVIGNASSLERCPIWKEMVQNARARRCYRVVSGLGPLQNEDNFYNDVPHASGVKRALPNGRSRAKGSEKRGFDVGP